MGKGEMWRTEIRAGW